MKLQRYIKNKLTCKYAKINYSDILLLICMVSICESLINILKCLKKYSHRKLEVK